MDAKVAAEAHEGQQSCSSPAEASRSVSFSSSNLPPMTPGHRRAQSEVVGVGQRRANGFKTLKSQMQNAWRWGNTYREEKHRLSFNPEVLAVQKRQWYQLQSKSRDQIKYKEPTSIFEHFIIAGLHPDANLDAAGEALIKRKRWEKQIAESGMPEYRIKQQRGPQIPTFEPQLLFKYPPAKKLAVRSKDLATFCFPEGVKARLLERTPSFSDLNELLYGQEHLGTDDLSFVFSLKMLLIHGSGLLILPVFLLSPSYPPSSKMPHNQAMTIKPAYHGQIGCLKRFKFVVGELCRIASHQLISCCAEECIFNRLVAAGAIVCWKR